MMNAQLVGVRPTLYVLHECLSAPDDWANPEQYRAVKQGRFKDAGPLSQLQHPVIQSGNWATSDPECANSHIVYKHAVTCGMPTPWRELKPGQWRGLVTQPKQDAQWWILFAGLRRAGDESNVYRKLDLMKRHALLALYPTSDDYTLQKLEVANATEKAWEASCAASILSSVSKSITLNHKVEVTLPLHPSHKGAELVVDFHVERVEDQQAPHELPADIFLTVHTKNWSDSTLRDVVVPIMIGLIDPVQEHWEIIEHNGKDMVYLVQTTEVKIQQLLAAETLANASIDTYTHKPEVPRTHYAHYARQRILTDAYVYGIVSQAICGFNFVPSQDVSDMKICPDCERIYEAYAT
ncbi:DUF3039 domain-containing protein [Glutamicibacter sp. 287]|uniref:DUF3039 domain-containing protein n=1 Tax=unclassified Glutamicibacter TaxID=2627139 RepID=UPI000BB81E8D|nr:DUF3039 domain-containing protein [Glutamicibacter sp. BW80]PCC28688.1 hypothetical protein CIK76_10750 [Glutamicibacter sp. BW80]